MLTAPLMAQVWFLFILCVTLVWILSKRLDGQVSLAKIFIFQARSNRSFIIALFSFLYVQLSILYQDRISSDVISPPQEKPIRLVEDFFELRRYKIFTRFEAESSFVEHGYRIPHKYRNTAIEANPKIFQEIWKNGSEDTFILFSRLALHNGFAPTFDLSKFPEVMHGEVQIRCDVYSIIECR